MIARSLNAAVVFSKPFLLKGVDRMLPAGDYRVVTDEELIEGISFPVYRRISTMIFVPAAHGTSRVEMVTIDPARSSRCSGPGRRTKEDKASAITAAERKFKTEAAIL